MKPSFNGYPLHKTKNFAKMLGDQAGEIQALLHGGLLPSVDRTRGALSQTKPDIVNFSVDQKRRRVYLTLAFYPIDRQYVQGAHGRWSLSLVDGIWNATFRHKTTPGHLLLAFIATQGNIFADAGEEIGLPTICTTDGIEDTDWVVLGHKTTPVGHPFTSALTVAYRFVRSDERTLSPVLVKGSLNNTASQNTGIWLWEIEGGRAPTEVTSSVESGVSNHQFVEVGDDLKGTIVGGFVTALFNRDISPVVTPRGVGQTKQVTGGTTFANLDAGNAASLIDGKVWAGAFGGEWHTPVVSGTYWERTWTSPVDITHISLVTLLPWVFYQPANPPSVVSFDDGTSFNIPATGNYQAIGVDLEVPHTVSHMRVTFQGPTPTGSFTTESGWNEIIAWYSPPDQGERLQSADMSNNPNPYHGLFANGSNNLDHPWMYIGQKVNGKIGAEVYMDLSGNVDSGTAWSTAGISIVVPDLRVRLPHIPYPLVASEYYLNNEPDGEPILHDIIRENNQVVGSGEGLAMTAFLYASGVRVYIDGQDISQFIFGAPSGLIDSTSNLFEDIDISTWVRSPGGHTLTITTDEGEADVDTRFETI